jgi:hypothetical protein
MPVVTFVQLPRQVEAMQYTQGTRAVLVNWLGPCVTHRGIDEEGEPYDLAQLRLHRGSSLIHVPISSWVIKYGEHDFDVWAHGDFNQHHELYVRRPGDPAEFLPYQKLRLAISDCYALARRMLRRPGAQLDEQQKSWSHIRRFCERAGLRSSILREAKDDCGLVPDAPADG